MKKLLCTLLFLPLIGISEDRWDQPYDEVYVPDIVYDRVTIELEIVDDADAVCRKYGANFDYVINHCTVQWTEPTRTCIIVMNKNILTMGSLGHEARHCFEGDWHDRNLDDSKIQRR